jgi:hypothetical protein
LVKTQQNRNPYTLLVGMQIGTTIKESSMEIPQKYQSWASKECKSGYNRDTCTLMFIPALFTIAKLWKQPRCPTTDELIKQLWYIYTVT